MIYTTERQLMIYQVITEVLQVFADTEIGTDIALNNKVIAAYLNSDEHIGDYFDAKTKEDCYAVFTNQILNGYPVWRMLDLPEWTMSQMEKEFHDRLDQQEQKAKQQYKCLTCTYYSEIQCAFGILPKCTRLSERSKSTKDRFLPERKQKTFEIKEECEHYIQGEPHIHYAKISSW